MDLVNSLKNEVASIKKAVLQIAEKKKTKRRRRGN
jgi:hypothetical protein